MSEKRVSKLGKILVTILLLPAAIIVPVLSLESHYAPPTKAQEQTTSQAQRIAEYKAKLGREVSKTEKEKLKLRCDVAQANSKTLENRLSKVQTTRTAAYDSIVKDLNSLLERLNKQAYETSSLQKNINNLQSKIDTYKTDMATYTQAVGDMATVDCSNDPLAFISALDTARKAHDSVQAEQTDIRAFVVNTVKPTLKQIRTQIQDGNTTGGSQ